MCKEFKVENDALMLSKRGSENLAWDMVIFMQRKYCGQTLVESGRDCTIASYSSVCSASERVTSRLVTDRQLKEKASKIETKFNKGQRGT